MASQIFCMFMFVTSLLMQDSVSVDSADLERKVIASRLAIKSGAFEYKSILLGPPGRPRKLTFSHRHFIAFQDGDIRMDTAQSTTSDRLGDGKGAPPLPEMIVKTIIRDGKCVQYTGPGNAVVIRSDKSWKEFYFDPRIVGIHARSSAFMDRVTLNDALGGSSRKTMSATVETLDGQTVHVLRITLENGSMLAFFAVPDFKFAVVRSEAKYSTPRGVYEYVRSSKLKKYPGEIWYPEQITLKTTKDGVWVSSEEMIIQNVTINAPLKEGTFSLEGLDIPAGTRVIDLLKGVQQEWNGSELASRVAPPASSPQVAATIPNAPVGKKVLWAVNLGGVAVFFFCLFLRRRYAR